LARAWAFAFRNEYSSPTMSRSTWRRRVTNGSSGGSADVSAGSSVDVYLRPASHAGCQGSPVCGGKPVLSGVTVLDAPPVDQEFGAGGQRMLVLGMSSGQAHTFFRLLASVDEPSLTVVGRD